MDEAVEMVNNGDDLQKITARLDHTDPSTVLALIGKWYRDYVKTDIPNGPFAGNARKYFLEFVNN